MKQKLCSLILAAALISSCAAGASAAQVDVVPVEAERDLGVVAADYPDVGSDLEPEGALPAAFSNREYAAAVRNQQFNTCWAYSSCGVMELIANKAGIYDGWFSPMHMNYWATKHDDGSGWQRSYTDAGYPYIAIGYLTSMTGAVKEDDFPASSDYSDYLDLTEPIAPFAGANSLVYLNGESVDTIKTAVYKYGAAVGNFHYVYSYLNNETSSYFCDEAGLATSQLKGHAIAIVGWDDNYSRENFGYETSEPGEDGEPDAVVEYHRPENDGAWLCKNSWGPSWSNMDGYFWISYEDYYLFENRFGPSYAVMGLEQYSDHKKLYQNEEYGAIYEFSYISDTKSAAVEKAEKLTFVNIYDFGDGYNELDKVVFETTSLGSDYEVFYIPLGDDGLPVQEESQWTFLGAGTVDYNGYYCVDFDNITVPSAKAGIGVSIKKTDISSAMTIGSSEWLTVSGGRFIFQAPGKKGDCYILGYGTKTWELMDYYEQKLDDTIGGAFVIKAIAERIDVMGDVDLDGLMTILDVTYIQRYLADLNPFTDYQKELADYDGDGDVTILDCTKIQRVLADIEPPLYPVGG